MTYIRTNTTPILALLLLLVSACAQLSLAPADTFDKKLAYAYGTHTAVLQSAASAVTHKDISKEDGQQVLKLADESRTLLDAAQSLSASGDLTGANSKLVLATAILTQLQTYLRSKQ